MNTIIYLITVAVLLLSNMAYAEVRISVGEVYEVKTGKLIYREKHQFKMPSPADPSQSMLTNYVAPDDSLMAERTVNFSGDYVSDYVFKQAGLGIEKSVVRSDSQIKYTGKEGDKQKTKSFKPKNIQTAVVNAGMFNAVDRSWEKLLDGDTVKIELVVPDRGRTFTMKLKMVEIARTDLAKAVGADGSRLKAEGKVAFTLSIANPVLRLLLAPVELGYDTESRRLVYYQGPSNLKKSDGGKIGTIRIAYQNSTR